MIIQKLIEMFVNKSRIIGWVSAGMIAIGAAYAGMSSKDFKDIVCKADIVEALPK